ncbi:MAG: transcriptional repressor LexA [Deltaproteobacteria bacterium]|nr:transcriptional repressor LexA [Deltaproteobacteria bacterium]
MKSKRTKGIAKQGKGGPGRRPIVSITDHQRRTLREIRDFIARKGYPPTIQELAEILGISHASTHAQVSQLVRKGYLRREPRKARGLAVVREPEDEITNLVRVPILGRVAAGRPLFAEENVIGEVLVEGRVASGGPCFALEVDGDSMVKAGIHEGNLVIVRQQPVAESGDIVVALLGEETTVKRLYIREEKIELRPENPKYQPISIGPDDDLRILGKVVATRRKSENGYLRNTEIRMDGQSEVTNTDLARKDKSL